MNFHLARLLLQPPEIIHRIVSSRPDCRVAFDISIDPVLRKPLLLGKSAPDLLV